MANSRPCPAAVRGSTRLILRRNLDQQRTARALRRRLADKIANYEREAARLDIRGQADAAKVLRRAATNLKTLTGQGADARCFT